MHNKYRLLPYQHKQAKCIICIYYTVIFLWKNKSVCYQHLYKINCLFTQCSMYVNCLRRYCAYTFKYFPELLHISIHLCVMVTFIAYCIGRCNSIHIWEQPVVVTHSLFIFKYKETVKTLTYIQFRVNVWNISKIFILRSISFHSVTMTLLQSLNYT